MSSAIFINFTQPINLEDWMEFCKQYSIKYSPNTVGQNVFYRGNTEIQFGKRILEEHPKKVNGEIDFGKTIPRLEATRIVISTYWMGELEGVAETATLILGKWRGEFECDIELNGLMESFVGINGIY